MSFSAAILILVIIAVRALAIHKLPKMTFLILWGVALCRLTIPFSIPAQFSAYTIMNRITELVSTTSTQTITNNIDIFPGNNTVNSFENIMQQASIAFQLSLVSVIWFLGVLFCALVFMVTHLRCRREYANALPVDNDYIKKWLQEHQIQRTIQIRQSDRINAPMTYGILKPKILFPKNTEWQNEVSLRYILAHEFVHIKRFDALLKWILAASLCSHWFNPLVWIMYILANRDIEISCDETVIWAFGEKMKSVYALILIELEEKKISFLPLVNSFSKNSIEERINAIMNMKKISPAGIIKSLILVIVVTTAFATSAISVTGSLILKSTNLTPKISRRIEGILKSNHIDVESIVPSHDAIIEGMDPHWTAYNLINMEGDKFLLIVRADGKDFSALLDSDNNLIEGLIDSGVLPKYFETDAERTQPELFTHGTNFEKALDVNGMVAALGADSTEGWIYARELETYPSPGTPEEALELQKLIYIDYPDGYKYVDLYDKDGSTIIGKFKVELGSNNAMYKDNLENKE